MITKQIAGILYGNSYRLYEVATGKVLDIQGIIDNSVLVSCGNDWTLRRNFDQIGTDFLIIARPLSDLTKEIENSGSKFIPAKVMWSVDASEEDEFDIYGTLPDYWIWNIKMLNSALYEIDYRDMDWLHKWNFAAPLNIPEGTWIDINQIEK